MKNPIPMTIPRMALEQKLASTNLIFEKAMVDIERIQPQLKYSWLIPVVMYTSNLTIAADV